jgi:hypothetical protein
MSGSFDHIFSKGLSSSLETTEIVDGKLRFTTDTCELFLDLAPTGLTATRKKISDIIMMDEDDIFDIIAPLPKVYVATDTNRAYVNNGTDWVDLAKLKLTVNSSTNSDIPILFTTTSDDDVSYNSSFTYNPNTQTLKAPNMTASTSVKVNGLTITDTVSNNIHTVNFSFSS